LHLNFPVENIDNRVRIMPVDRVDGSWGELSRSLLNLAERDGRASYPQFTARRRVPT
jgi:hypothetical protein